MSNYPKKIYVLPARQPRAISTGHVASPQKAQKRPIPTEQIVAELLGDDLGPSGPRKRERLTHLTQEEKMDRRKMKNRVAAQNARDKKKERSGKIDQVMLDLVEENRLLRAENEKLRRQNEDLLNQINSPVYDTPVYTPEAQNENNEANIYSNVVYEEEVADEDVVNGGCVMEDQLAFESAVFINAPLQWDKAPRSANNATPLNFDANISNINHHRRMDTNRKINVETYLTLVSILCNHMDRIKKMSNNYAESSNNSRAQQENSTNSLLTTLKKEVTVLRRRLRQDLSTVLPRRRVEHFRRVP
uniref:X-box-binding protein 1 n=1 Tax=Caenorhabditis tropicalis TaxID=1561998 RepID=A0A1I7TT26_9PELO